MNRKRILYVACSFLATFAIAFTIAFLNSFTVTLKSYADKPFQKITSNEGHFTIEMPGNPKIEVTHPSDKISITSYTLYARDLAYVVAVADPPAPEIDSDQAILDRAENGMLGGSLSHESKTLIKKSDISLNGKFLGRELEADYHKQDGLGRNLIGIMRMYIVNRRLYMVRVGGTPEAVHSPHAEKFFDSFAVTQ